MINELKNHSGRRQLKRRDSVRTVLSENFDEYLTGIIHEWLKRLTVWGFTLVPIFFILDYFIMPEEILFRFGAYRFISTVVLIAQFFIILHTKVNKWTYLHGHLITLNIAGIIVLMTIDLGGFNSSYYAGLNLVIIAVNLLLPWSMVHSALNCAIVIALYLSCNIIVGHAFVKSILINNLFFLFATTFIAISINYLKYKLVRQEFFLLNELKKARDALWGEMEIASRIQTALLPDKEKMRGLEISAIMLPAKEVGGDYYDVIESENGYKWITIGDVSGHGVDSGLIMMMAQTSILTAINNNPECQPSDVLKLVNKVIRENISRLVSDHFMTMMAIRFKDSKMMIAGKHQDIVIYRSALNKTEIISNKGTWLGVVDDMSNHVEDVEIPLEDGDLVLLFSDGITESENSNGEMYGQKRLEVALDQYADLPVKKIVGKIIQKVKAFQEKQQDDMTLLVLKKLQSE